MQQHADALRRLPHHRLNPNFSLAVLQSIADRGLRPAWLRPATAARRFLPVWPGYAAAAAVLLAVGAVSFLYFADLLPGSHRGPSLAQQGRGVDRQPLAPQKDMETFAQVTGTPFKPRELLEDRFREQLQKDNAIRLDLACSQTNITLALLQEVLKEQGITLILDQIARTRQLDKDLKSNFVLYLEDIPVDDLFRLLQRLAGKNNSFESMVVSSMTAPDRTQLASLMNINAELLQPPSSRLPGMNLRRAWFQSCRRPARGESKRAGG